MARVAATGMQPAAWPPLRAALCARVEGELEGVLAALVPFGLQKPGGRVG